MDAAPGLCPFGYSCVGFFLLPLLFGGGMALEANKARVISAIFLPFYTGATAVLLSALNFERFDAIRRCLNGHSMQPLAKFCEECGAPALRETIYTKP
jgi:hypothetical protein